MPSNSDPASMPVDADGASTSGSSGGTGQEDQHAAQAALRRGAPRRRGRALPARQGQAHRARAHRPAARRRLLHGARHVRAAPDDQFRHGATGASAATGSSPAGERSRAGRCSSSATTRRCSVARSARSSLRRSPRSWISRCGPDARASASTTPVVRASRRASSRWPGTPRSSIATSRQVASSRSSR